MSDTLAVETELHCPRCGYDLRAIDSGRCPECGLEIDRDTPRSRIPWTQRHRIGLFRAYWRTVRLVMFNPRAVGREAAGWVDCDAARMFRWITVALAAVGPIGLTATAVTAAKIGSTPINAVERTSGEWRVLARIDWIAPWLAGVMIAPIAAICTLLTLALVVGSGDVLFDPRRLPVARQNTAIAVAHYACAPLSLLIFISAFGGAVWAVFATGLFDNIPLYSEPAVDLLRVSAPILAIFILFLFWFDTALIHRAATGAGRLKTIGTTIGLACLWAICAAVGGLALPWLVGLVRLIIASVD